MDKSAIKSLHILAESSRRMEDIMSSVQRTIDAQTDILKSLSDQLSGQAKGKKEGGGSIVDKLSGKDSKEAVNNIKGLAETIPLLTKNLLFFALVPKKVKDNFVSFIRDFYLAITAPGGKEVDSAKAKQDYANLGSAFESISQNIAKLALGIWLFDKVVSEKTAKNVTHIIGQMSKGFEKMNPEKMKTGGEAIKEMGKGLFLFSVSLAASLVFLVLGLPALLPAAIAILSMGKLYEWVGKRADKIEKGAEALAWASLSLVGVGLSLWIFKAFNLNAKDLLMPIMATSALALVFGLIGRADKTIKNGALAMFESGLALITVALGFAFFKLTNVTVKDILMTTAAVSGLALGMYIAGKFGNAVEKGAVAMFFAGLSLITVAIGFVIFKKAGVEWEDIAKVGALIGGLGIVFGLAGLAAPQIAAGSVAMMFAGLALIVVGVGVALYKKLDPKPEDIDGLFSLVVKLGGSMAIAGLAAPLIIAGSSALMMAGLALIVIGVGVKLYKMLNPQPKDVEGLFDLVVKVGGSFAVAGLASPLILLGSAAMMLASISLMILGVGIKVFQKLNVLGDTKFGENLNTLITDVAYGFALNPITFLGVMMGAPAMMLASVALITLGYGLKKFKEVNWTEKDRLGLTTTLDSVTDSFANIGGPFKMIAAYAGIAAVKDAGKALFDIALGLLEFQKLKVDPKAMGASIASVISIVSDAFATIGAKNASASLFGFIPVSENLVQKGIESVQGIGNVLFELAQGVQKFAELKFTNSEGKEIMMDAGTMKLVAENISTVLMAVGDAFAYIGKNESSIFGGDVSNGVKAVQGMGGELLAVAQAVQQYASMKYTNAEGKEVNITPGVLKAATLNMTAVILAVADVFAKIGSGDLFDEDDVQAGVEAIKGIGSELQGIAEFIKAFTDSKAKMTPGQAILEIFDAISQLGTKVKPADISLLAQASIWIEKLGKAASPIEKLANSFGKMAKSIKEFSGAFKQMQPATLMHSEMLIQALVAFAKADPNALNVNTEKGKELFDYVHGASPVIKEPSAGPKSTVTPAPSQPTIKGEQPSNKPGTATKVDNNTKALEAQNAQLIDVLSNLTQEMSSMKAAMVKVQQALTGVLSVREVK